MTDIQELILKNEDELSEEEKQILKEYEEMCENLKRQSRIRRKFINQTSWTNNELDNE